MAKNEINQILNPTQDTSKKVEESENINNKYTQEFEKCKSNLVSN